MLFTFTGIGSSVRAIGGLKFIMSNFFNDTVAKKAYLVTCALVVIGLLFLFLPDTNNVHGGGIITVLGGLFLIGLSILGIILFFVIRILSK